jgi:hypothetical protein
MFYTKNPYYKSNNKFFLSEDCLLKKLSHSSSTSKYSKFKLLKGTVWRKDEYGKMVNSSELGYTDVFELYVPNLNRKVEVSINLLRENIKDLREASKLYFYKVDSGDNKGLIVVSKFKKVTPFDILKFSNQRGYFHVYDVMKGYPTNKHSVGRGLKIDWSDVSLVEDVVESDISSGYCPFNTY